MTDAAASMVTGDRAAAGLRFVLRVPGGLNRMTAVTNTRRSVGLVGNNPASRSVVFALMQAARRRFPEKAAPRLAAIIGCDVKTVERYFAGSRAPNADAFAAMLRHPIGIALVEEATRELPREQYREFWTEMALASLAALAQGGSQRSIRRLNNA